jgi:hypothetical protein
MAIPLGMTLLAAVIFATIVLVARDRLEEWFADRISLFYWKSPQNAGARDVDGLRRLPRQTGKVANQRQEEKPERPRRRSGICA